MNELKSIEKLLKSSLDFNIEFAIYVTKKIRKLNQKNKRNRNKSSK
jgi:hypothetical protein